MLTFGEKIIGLDTESLGKQELRVKVICAELIDIISDRYNEKKPMTDAEMEVFNTALVKILKAEDAILFAISSTK